MSDRSRLILVVDDDPEVAESHRQLLERLDYRALVQCDPGAAETMVATRADFDLVLLDVRMPGVDGLELLRRIKAHRPEVGVVMVTVVNDVENAVRAIKSGAYNYLLKPLQPERLKQVLDSFFANQPRRLVDDRRFASFITGCPGFEKIFQDVKVLAEADVAVLIQGETGTGKELVAQEIHSLSRRRSERFLPVNVASLAPTLLESELFGYKRGAFTGAMVDHAGYFEEAGTGTIFLDEIGDLAHDQQAKVLRVLETRAYCRVGEAQERELKARVVVATNRDVREAVRAGRFREDLYYRLGAHCVTLPPLRERPGDVELLAQYFLRKYCSQFGRAVEGFEPEALKILNEYSFPGNVRELEGIVSNAVLIEQGRRVRKETLPKHVRIADDGSGDLKTARYRTIMQALAECDGNQTRAAEKLGIARQTLNRLLKEYRERGLKV